MLTYVKEKNYLHIFNFDEILYFNFTLFINHYYDVTVNKIKKKTTLK